MNDSFLDPKSSVSFGLAYRLVPDTPWYGSAYTSS